MGLKAMNVRCNKNNIFVIGIVIKLQLQPPIQ